MPMSPKISAVTVTDLAKVRKPAFFWAKIRQVKYKKMNDNNIFSHSKAPSARLIAPIRDNPEIVV
jgi:hypothetical protein